MRIRNLCKQKSAILGEKKWSLVIVKKQESFDGSGKRKPFNLIMDKIIEEDEDKETTQHENLKTMPKTLR